MNLLRMTKELFSDSFGRAIESVKTKIYRDSASGLDINVYPTKDEIVKKTLDKNKKDNEIDRLLGSISWGILGKYLMILTQMK
nr:hypothetical protein [Mycoplasmopsis bovis]